MAHTDTARVVPCLGIARRQHFHITLEDHSTVTLNCGITRLADSASLVVFLGYTSQDWFADNGLPATSLQYDAAPVIRERQIDGRFQVNTGASGMSSLVLTKCTA